jgi:hypothetical protein
LWSQFRISDKFVERKKMGKSGRGKEMGYGEI